MSGNEESFTYWEWWGGVEGMGRIARLMYFFNFRWFDYASRETRRTNSTELQIRILYNLQRSTQLC